MCRTARLGLGTWAKVTRPNKVQRTHLILFRRLRECARAEYYHSLPRKKTNLRMATTLLRFFATPSTVSSPSPKRIRHRSLPAHPQPQRLPSLRHRLLLPGAYKVTIEHEGETRTLDVGEDETILGRALEEGLAVPHDCKLGVCMTCPARLVSGAVDQSEGMLSDDVIERGYTLLCVSYPRTDCQIRTIPEEELLSLQLATAND